MKPLPEAVLAKLRAVDTPTICNAIEEIEGKRRADNFTRYPVVSCNIKLPAICGYAKTGTIRAAHAPHEAKDVLKKRRLDYYRYLSKSPAPSLVVIEDLDYPKGIGAYWGEVQTNIHKALGCLGTITNGSIRDIPQVAPGFQMLAGSIAPSHAFVHVVDFGGNVNIHGMAVKSGDLIHADRHGAVVVPLATIDPMKEAAPKLAAKEAQIIDAAKSGKGVEAIKAAMK